MKAFITFAVLIATVLAVPAPKLVSEEDDGMKIKSLLVETSPGVYEVEDLVNSEIDPRASPSDISFYFFNRQTEALRVPGPSDVHLLKGNKLFDTKKDTAVFIHGWRDSNESDFNYNLRVAALTNHDINVFIVDWHTVSQRNYITSRYAVVRLGQAVGAFVQALVDTFGLNLDKLTIAGHSLGAQIAGNAGEALKGKVGHIVGLDPALPLFTNGYGGDRLDPTDAKFVQVIHTNAGFLGFQTSIGHADYFPNGGESQKGCGLDIGKVCSHCRAWEFYAESLASNRFIARACTSYLGFLEGLCRSSRAAYMGGLYPDRNAKGDYFLDTATTSKFALG